MTTAPNEMNETRNRRSPAMAKRKPDRIEAVSARLAAKYGGCTDVHLLASDIAALVRREVRRVVEDEHASLRAEIVRIKANLSGARNATLVDQWRQCLGTIESWLDAREGR